MTVVPNTDSSMRHGSGLCSGACTDAVEIRRPASNRSLTWIFTDSRDGCRLAALSNTLFTKWITSEACGSDSFWRGSNQTRFHLTQSFTSSGMQRATPQGVLPPGHARRLTVEALHQRSSQIRIVQIALAVGRIGRAGDDQVDVISCLVHSQSTEPRQVKYGTITSRPPSQHIAGIEPDLFRAGPSPGDADVRLLDCT